MTTLTVIICTHNPRPEFLEATLGALRQQTLPVSEWELLLVDNASAQPLAKTWDISWHPCARHIREEELGLTPARLRGIAEATGELLVFVDDDNLLDADYLENARRIADQWPMLGVWGGAIRPRFEIPPPDWAKPHLSMLALVECEQSRWSNLPDRGDTHPCGAGMATRKAIAVRYAQNVRSDPKRKRLGRRGNNLSSCEDTDLVLTAIDLGLGSGVFKELKLTHIIPQNRITEEYLLKLRENLTCSGMLLLSLRARELKQPSFIRRVAEFARLLTMNTYDRRFELARLRGMKRAKVTLSEIHATEGN